MIGIEARLFAGLLGREGRFPRHRRSPLVGDAVLTGQDGTATLGVDALDPLQDGVQSLMKPVLEIGKFANYIAPPARGINRMPVDFEYVKFH